ncbi:MAG TPA: SPOR domain-containing protein [Vicinamibacterales bacterium]
MAHAVQDDSFREIQLNGKQLVFLFMAATVVSVVIFLCGVLVGRGVRAERSIGAEAGAASTADPAPSPEAKSVAEAGSDPTKVPPPSPAADAEVLSYPSLGSKNPPVDKLKPEHDKPSASAAPIAEKPSTVASAKTSVAAVPTPPPAPVVKPKDTPKETAHTDLAPEPTQSGFAVQIAALNVRTEAEAIAKRLNSKGYTAYVLSPASGTPSVYRVRVGKYGTRREAESIAERLQKEEQFKPWVTR